MRSTLLALPGCVLALVVSILGNFFGHLAMDRLRNRNEELQVLVFHLQMDNEKMKDQLNDCSVLKKCCDVNVGKRDSHGFPELTMQYDAAGRRAASRNILEMWNYIVSELKSVMHLSSNNLAATVRTLDRLTNFTDVYKSDIFHNIQILNKVNEWHRLDERKFSNLIQTRLKYLQNPRNCASAKKILCQFEYCGYGCQMHHLIFCLLTAYATNRTLVTNFSKWRYKESLEEFYAPLSLTCNYKSQFENEVVDWPGNLINSSVIRLPVMGYMNPLPTFMFPAIPREITSQLLQLKEEPFAWWIGQFFKYVLRPKKTLEATIESITRSIGYQHFIAGIQIRRTDKLKWEGSFHKLSEYMEHVEEFYARLNLKEPNVTRRVYLATDDPSVLPEAKLKYPSYAFITSKSMTLASDTAARFGADGLLGIILDIHLLARSDFLVCTFSSNICRMAYVIMTTLNPEAWLNYRSLDEAYSYTPNAPHHQIAVRSYRPARSDEIELQPGDIISVMNTYWNGFTTGTNLRTKLNGRFPSFMAVDTVPTADMPSFFEASS